VLLANNFNFIQNVGLEGNTYKGFLTEEFKISTVHSDRRAAGSLNGKLVIALFTVLP